MSTAMSPGYVMQTQHIGKQKLEALPRSTIIIIRLQSWACFETAVLGSPHA